MSGKLLSRSPGAAITNIKTCYYCSMFVGLLAAVLRSVAFATSFDSGIGYFNGTLFPTAVNYLMIVGCLFAVLCGFITSKEAKLPVKLGNESNAVFFTSCFAGFVLVADFVYKLVVIAVEDKLDYYKFIFAPGYNIENAYLLRATAVVEILGVISSLAAAVYFFLRASKKAGSKLTVWLGFFPIIRALVGIAEIYFEMDIQMNHPSKLMLQFALMSIMLCFLFEQRFSVSDTHARPRLYFASACVAVILGFAGGVSEMYGYFSGQLKRGDFCVEAFLCLTMSYYILARLNSFVSSAARPEPDAPAEAEPALENEDENESAAEESVSE
ncbi:MAG: hypothetical protein ACI3XI_00700 [Eubacteriales bacterium]